MRKYQPLWSSLKKARTVTIEADVANHFTIIGCLKKEKNLDVAYKFTCLEQGFKLKLQIKTEGSHITFKLVPVLSSSL